MSQLPESIIAIAAVSADGFIAAENVADTSWKSPEDAKTFPGTLEKFPTRIMGRTTFEHDVLPRILSAGKIVLPPSCVQRIVFTKNPAAFKAWRIEGQLEFTSDSPETILARLATDGCRKVAVLGGGAIYNLFSPFLTGAIITHEPVALQKGTPLFSSNIQNPLENSAVVSEQRLNDSGTRLVEYAFTSLTAPI